MEVFFASRFFLSFGCHSLLEAKKQQKMRQGDIGKWQEDTENVFYVPLPFSNVLLPHFLPSLAVKKAVKKMGIEFMYYHKINFIFINAFVTFNCKLPKTQMAKFNDWFLGILLYIQTPHHKHFLVDTSEVAYMLNSQWIRVFSSSNQSRFFKIYSTNTRN